MAIQLARARVAHVFATAGTAEKCAACVALGAAQAFITARPISSRRRSTPPRTGVDVVLDIVAGTTCSATSRCSRSTAVWLLVGQLGGPKSQINTTPVFRKRLTITASTLRAALGGRKGSTGAGRACARLATARIGQVRILVHSTYPLRAAAEAHRMMESSSHIGKTRVDDVMTFVGPSFLERAQGCHVTRWRFAGSGRQENRARRLRGDGCRWDDLQMLALALPSVSKELGLSNVSAGALGTYTLAGMGIGGILAGRLADHIGRVRVTWWAC